MATNIVNLDALIPREDFEVVQDAPAASGVAKDTVEIRDLEKSAFFYGALKKPDFQRETASWSPEKIQDFVKTFLEGDLVPAIILWRTGQNIFVIDGAHRLSALIAWVNDDYGDNAVSRAFFDNYIPPEQQKAADKTRTLLKKIIGTYAEHRLAVENPETSRPEVVLRARRLGSFAVQLQWVTGDAKKAEASFFKINQEATPIDKTELRLLKSRNSPNALAARAIVRAGTGHRYWSKFSKQRQEEVEKLGKEIYDLLFTPPLNMPIKTLDIPVAGRGYSAQTLPLIFDLVNLANDVKLTDPTKSKVAIKLPDDEDGEQTIKYLKNTQRIVWRITGIHPSSLGLHPAVYFYSPSGRYQTASFLAVVSLLKYLDKKRLYGRFTEVRRSFENFFIRNKNFPTRVVAKFGGGVKGFERLKELYIAVLEGLWAKKNDSKILESLRKDFSFLAIADAEEMTTAVVGQKFSTETKSAVFLKESLENPLRCKICAGLIHFNSIQVDHIIRKQDGGLGVVDNGQLTHPYCNSTAKG